MDKFCCAIRILISQKKKKKKLHDLCSHLSSSVCCYGHVSLSSFFLTGFESYRNRFHILGETRGNECCVVTPLAFVQGAMQTTRIINLTMTMKLHDIVHMVFCMVP
jgi:hypothetical protein